MKLLLLAALFWQPSVRCDQSPQEAKKVAEVGRPALDCVVQQARKLEKSGETAENIATAAVTTCNPVLDLYRDIITRCSDARFAEEMIAFVRKAGHDAAITAVVRIRAGR